MINTTREVRRQWDALTPDGRQIGSHGKSLVMGMPVGRMVAKLRPEEATALQEIFFTYDDDGSGSIGLEELRKIFIHLGVNLNEDQVRAIMKKFDSDGSEEIDFDEFVELMEVQKAHLNLNFTYRKAQDKSANTKRPTSLLKSLDVTREYADLAESSGPAQWPAIDGRTMTAHSKILRLGRADNTAQEGPDGKARQGEPAAAPEWRWRAFDDYVVPAPLTRGTGADFPTGWFDPKRRLKGNEKTDWPSRIKSRCRWLMWECDIAGILPRVGFIDPRTVGDDRSHQSNLLGRMTAQYPYFTILALLFIFVLLSSVWWISPPTTTSTQGVFDAIDDYRVEQYDAYNQLNIGTVSQSVVSLLSLPTWSIQLLYVSLLGTPILEDGLTRNAIAAVERAVMSIPSLSSYCYRDPASPPIPPVFSTPERPTGKYAANLEVCNGAYLSVLNHRNVPYLPLNTTALTSTKARSAIVFGSPLQSYRSNVDRFIEQEDALAQWVSSTFVPTLLDAKASVSDVLDVYMLGVGIAPYYYAIIQISDRTFVILASVFVFTAIAWRCRSIVLGAVGILHILVSYQAAYAPYRLVVGYRTSPGILQVALFVILGIGADDIFLLRDVWIRSHSDRDTGINNSLLSKMSSVLSHAVGAMFVTTFTTFVAFIATALSPIPAIAAFGGYTAIVVLFNYLFMMTWFPACMTVWHKYLEFRRFPRSLREFFSCSMDVPPHLLYHPANVNPMRYLRPGRRNPTVGDLMSTAETAEWNAHLERQKQLRREAGIISGYSDSHGLTLPSADDLQQRRPYPPPFGMKAEPFEAEVSYSATAGVRIFRNHVFPFVRFFRWPFFIAGILTLLGAFYFATLLQPSAETDLGLPNSHPLVIATNMAKFEYVTQLSSVAGVTNENSVCIVYGVTPSHPLSRAGVDPNDETWRGTPILDPAFAFTPEVASEMSAVCQGLLLHLFQNYSYIVEFDRRNFSGTYATVPCFPWAFELWLRNASINGVGQYIDINRPPRGLDATSMSQLASAFITSSQAGRRFLGDVGLVTTSGSSVRQVKWVTQCFSMNLTTPVNKESNAAMKNWDGFLVWRARLFATKYRGSTALVQYHTCIRWVQVVSAELLQFATITSVLASLGLAMLVILLATGNFLIAIYSVIVMCTIVAFIFAFMYALDWSLGFIESISLTVLVGMTVDYVVHYGNAYHEGSAYYDYRQRRTRHVFVTMGSSVLGAAITSVLAGLFLLPSTFKFFVRFGAFMVLAIGLSFIFSNTFFAAMLIIAGPQKTQCSLWTLCCNAIMGCRTARKSKEYGSAPIMYETSNNRTAPLSQLNMPAAALNEFNRAPAMKSLGQSEVFMHDSPAPHDHDLSPKPAARFTNDPLRVQQHHVGDEDPAVSRSPPV